jgi:hypothetical protein
LRTALSRISLTLNPGYALDRDAVAVSARSANP